MKKETTYSKQVIEIADYMFANPSKKRQDVLGQFETIWDNISDSTIKRRYYEAKEYNKTRIQKQEKIKDKVLTNETQENTKSAILSRERSLEILSVIAEGKVRKLVEDMFLPSDGDRIRAIQQLSKMQGWDAPKEINLNNHFLELMCQASAYGNE